MDHTFVATFTDRGRSFRNLQVSSALSDSHVDARTSSPLVFTEGVTLSTWWTRLPTQDLADACVRLNRWGEEVRCFVLAMGLCGLRPSEATGVVVGDVELDGPDGTGSLSAVADGGCHPGSWTRPRTPSGDR